MAEGDITTNTLYKDRPEFKDVTPMYNSKAEDSIVPIALDEEFVDAFAYLRALMNAEEISERAFELTGTCAKLNPANYSVWEYRRKILKGLNKDLIEELQLCEESILENLKNYQVWHHRRELVLWINNKEVDMTFVDAVLNDDVKNYHAWQHRIFLVRHFKVALKTELRFSTEFISRDVFNNSAWNYRYFVVTEMSDNFEKTEIINDEIQFVMNYIQAAVNNASSWAYLSGLMEFSTFTAHPEVLDFTRKLLIPPDASQDAELVIAKSAPNSYALSFLAEAMIALIEEKNPQPNGLQTARACYERLIVVDPLRKRLWNYKLHEVLNLASV